MRRVGVWIAAIFLFSGFAFASGVNGLIMLLSDTGERDVYTAMIKGAVYSKNINANLDSITLRVAPYNVREAAYMLDLAAPTFPAGTVFCSIVETGPADKHKPIAALMEDGTIFVGPDDGFLTFVLLHNKMKEAREITNPIFLQDPKALDSAFPARDVYAVAATVLAKGQPFDTIGSPVKSLETFKIIQPALADNAMVGEVEYIDEFGNLITNITGDLLAKLGPPSSKLLSVEIGSESMEIDLVKSPSDVKEGYWYAMINPFGNFEIGRNGASANALLQVDAGTPIKIQTHMILLKPVK